MGGNPGFMGLSMVLLACTFVAAILTIVNLPGWLFYFRPDWIALLVVYWVLAIPNRVGVFYGMAHGLLLDLLLIKVFGLNALGMSLLAFVITRIYTQIRMFPIWQQAILVSLLIAIMKLLIGWVASWVSDFTFSRYYWYSTLGNIVIWPFLYIILRDIRRALKLK